MVIHYYPVMYDVENETGTSTKETVYKEVDWRALMKACTWDLRSAALSLPVQTNPCILRM